MTSREASILVDRKASRRTKARLRLCRMQMRRRNGLLLAGYTPKWVADANAKKTEVA